MPAKYPVRYRLARSRVRMHIMRDMMVTPRGSDTAALCGSLRRFVAWVAPVHVSDEGNSLAMADAHLVDCQRCLTSAQKKGLI